MVRLLADEHSVRNFGEVRGQCGFMAETRNVMHGQTIRKSAAHKLIVIAALKIRLLVLEVAVEDCKARLRNGHNLGQILELLLELGLESGIARIALGIVGMSATAALGRSSRRHVRARLLRRLLGGRRLGRTGTLLR